MNMHLNDNYLNVLGQINLDELHIQQAFEYYQQRYQGSDIAQIFVKESCRIDYDFRQNTDIGYCDRSMGKQIPKPRSPEGAAIRGSLQRSGLVRSTGHELFRGCIVFPTYDINGNVISAVGYRMGRIREDDKAIVYWHKPEVNSFVDSGMSLAKELIHEQTYH
jgi:DNA primase